MAQAAIALQLAEPAAARTPALPRRAVSSCHFLRKEPRHPRAASRGRHLTACAALSLRAPSPRNSARLPHRQPAFSPREEKVALSPAGQMNELEGVAGAHGQAVFGCRGGRTNGLRFPRRRRLQMAPPHSSAVLFRAQETKAPLRQPAAFGSARRTLSRLTRAAGGEKSPPTAKNMFHSDQKAVASAAAPGAKKQTPATSNRNFREAVRSPSCHSRWMGGSSGCIISLGFHSST